jgi:acetyltransferase EpsM
VVNSGAIIEHDVDIGRFALIAPAAAIGGVTVVGEDCFLGLGCRIRDHVTIGRGTVVGMGAVVVASLPDGVEVVGVPARVRSKVAHGHSS